MQAGNDLPQIIETVTTRKIREALDVTAKRKFFSFVFGETGRSKTLTAAHWASQNKNAVFLELEAATNCSQLIRQLTLAVMGREYQTTRQTNKELISFLKKNEKVIIIDEANQLFFSPNAQTTAKALEFLRRNVYDLTGTAVLLIFTSYSLEEFRHGRIADFLEQFRGRTGYTLQIPNRILKTSELYPLVSAYVTNPSKDLLQAAYDIASGGEGKIRTLIKYLDLCQEYVDEKGGSINASILKNLSATYESGGIWPEE